MREAIMEPTGRWRSAASLLWRTTAAGAAAGAMNAWLCYAGIPTTVDSGSVFEWGLVPAGALHGAILAVGAVLAWQWSRQAHWPRILLTAYLGGWIAGYVSWQPLRTAIDSGWPPDAWPFDAGWVSALFAPLQVFGFVTLIYVVLLAKWSPGRSSRGANVLAASIAGIGGSLWWWISWERWYFSLLHGAIWGVTVGLATWSAFGRREALAPRASARPTREAA
jgi:hypothetical protein